MAKGPSTNPVVELVTLAACRSLLDTLPREAQIRVATWLAQSVGARPNARAAIPDLSKELRRIVLAEVGAAPKAARGAAKGAGKKKAKKPAVKRTVKRMTDTSALGLTPVDQDRLKNFIRGRNPQTRADMAAALAGFLAETGTASFLPRHIVALNRLAGGEDFTNVTVALNCLLYTSDAADE